MVPVSQLVDHSWLCRLTVNDGLRRNSMPILPSPSFILTNENLQNTISIYKSVGYKTHNYALIARSHVFNDRILIGSSAP